MADDAMAKASDRVLWAWTGTELLALVAFALLFAPAALDGGGFGSLSPATTLAVFSSNS